MISIFSWVADIFFRILGGAIAFAFLAFMGPGIWGSVAGVVAFYWILTMDKDQ